MKLPRRIVGKINRERIRLFRSCKYALKTLLGKRRHIHFQLSWRMGNEITSIPVYEAAKRRLSGCRLSVTVNYPEVLLNNPYVDMVNPSRDDFDRVIDIRGIDPVVNLYDHLEKVLKFKIENRIPKIYSVGMQGDAEIDAWLDSNKGKVKVAISSEASWACKRWPLENYRRLAGDLERDCNAAVVDIGLDQVQKTGGFDLKGKTDTGRLMYILSKVDMFIGNDSGPLHAALALGKKAVGVFGPVIPKHMITPRDGFVAVHSDILCYGCWCRNIMKSPGVCPLEKCYCMERIDYEAVYGVVKKVIEEIRRGGGRSGFSPLEKGE